MLDLFDAVGSRITYPPDKQFPNWVEHLTTNDPFRQCNGNVGISDLVGLAASRGVTWYMAYKVYQGVDAEGHILSDEATLHGPGSLGRMRMLLCRYRLRLFAPHFVHERVRSPQQRNILQFVCRSWTFRLSYGGVE
jgi:hypothetical protein